jgi:intracellular septation protein A
MIHRSHQVAVKPIARLETGGSVSAVDVWQRITAQIGWRTLTTGVGLFGLFIIFLAMAQFATPNLVGNDGYYHIKMAYLMRTEGLRPAFDWLPFTVLNAEEFVNHHFLFHIALIPFTFGDLRLGAKLASVLFPALTFIAVWWLLRGQRVPYAALWSLGLLAVSEAFIYRMSMPRSMSLSLGVLVLALHWLLTGKYERLLPLAFLYVWLYNAFPLILVVTGIYVAAHWLTERRLEWRALLYAGLGVGLGLIINPYFPENVTFVYRHIVPKLTGTTDIRVGNEWYPYKTTQLMENSGLALVLFLGGVLALGLNDRRMDTRTATSLFVTILFGAMLFKARHFVEYFPAFGLIFAAMAWKPLMDRWMGSGAGRVDLDQPLDQAVRRLRHVELSNTWRTRLPAGVMVVALLPALWFNFNASSQSLKGSNPYRRYAEASAWLAANTPARARVYQTDWDDFTRLFFYNTHNTYILGLDPTYMQLYDPELYDVWVDISKGRVEHPSEAISHRFSASYVLTDLKHDDFLAEAEDDPNLVQVFRDEYAAVFQVVQPGEDMEEVMQGN